MNPKEKAESLMIIFKDYKLAYSCTEECVGALYDEGIREPQYWYDVQEELDRLNLKSLLSELAKS